MGLISRSGSRWWERFAPGKRHRVSQPAACGGYSSMAAAPVLIADAGGFPEPCGDFAVVVVWGWSARSYLGAMRTSTVSPALSHARLASIPRGFTPPSSRSQIKHNDMRQFRWVEY